MWHSGRGKNHRDTKQVSGRSWLGRKGRTDYRCTKECSRLMVTVLHLDSGEGHTQLYVRLLLHKCPFKKLDSTDLNYIPINLTEKVKKKKLVICQLN